MALRPGQSCRLPPFAPQILQPAEFVRDRRDARLDAPVPGVNVPARKHFFPRLGIGEPVPHVLVQRFLVALHRKDVVAALLHDQRRRLALRVHRVGRRRAPVQSQNLQKGRESRDLVRRPVDLRLVENESRPGLERLHQMQSGLLRGVQDRARQHLAVDRHLIRRIARKRRQQRLRELRQGGRHLLRIESIEQVGERVVARRTALELQESFQKLAIDPRVPGERTA